ncbi:uncharacterized protein LOC101856748 [Aplysia californica]|uniref:Uncharacterized protein LOC101856748 n=1 Tax=Aplysia californica TaxID=6500 RepID=A0ABM1A501_APLCA|nr:uncharacterized protein LOC101856748 [Aplysia californica]
MVSRNVWAIYVFVGVVLSVKAKECPPLTPPAQGVLKCQRPNGGLQCMSTCYGSQVFDTGEPVVVRNCNHVTGQWEEGDYLPSCVDECRSRLLSSYLVSKELPRYTASGDTEANSVIPLSERAVLGPLASYWRPEIEDLKQYIQVELPVLTRINGVVIRGDGFSDFVTSFRVLLSSDGITWYPYTDGEVADKFLSGSTDSSSEVTRLLSCPHEARFIRINPLTWQGHPALAFDLLGCPIGNEQRSCKPLSPPPFGVVNCEVDGGQMFCTGYCLGDRVFQGEGPVLTRTCTETTARFDLPDFPPCADRDATELPFVNITGFCMETEEDCLNIENGDYQYCGDCHYFSTCSHGYLYVRTCPASLQFDSINRLCDYKSRTCTSKNRRLWLAERRMRQKMAADDAKVKAELAGL